MPIDFTRDYALALNENGEKLVSRVRKKTTKTLGCYIQSLPNINQHGGEKNVKNNVKSLNRLDLSVLP